MQQFKVAGMESFMGMSSVSAAVKVAAANLTPAQHKEMRVEKRNARKQAGANKRGRGPAQADPGVSTQHVYLLTCCADSFALLSRDEWATSSH